MSSSRRTVDLRRRTYLALVSRIESQIRDLFAARAEADHMTQTSLAEKLGVNRSVVNRRLTGRSNMTIQTLADMIWATGGCVDIDIYDPKTRPDRNHALAQETIEIWTPTSAHYTATPATPKTWSIAGAG